MDRQALRIFQFDSLTDTDLLRQRYRELLFTYHPDRSPSKEAARRTAEIIRAYRLLTRQLQDYRRAANEQIYQLIEAGPHRIAVPLERVIGFVRTEETELQSLFLTVVARYKSQAYILYTLRKGMVSAAQCRGWILLLNGSRQCGLLFSKKPERIRFSSSGESIIMKSKSGSTLILAGLEYRILRL